MKKALILALTAVFCFTGITFSQEKKTTNPKKVPDYVIKSRALTNLKQRDRLKKDLEILKKSLKTSKKSEMIKKVSP